MSKTDDSADLDLLERVEKSPELTSYVIRNKIGEVKKNAIIVALVASTLAFALGFVAGMNIFHIGQPKNIVEVQVSKE